jgi:S1-C subfamily serine protease
MALRSFLYAATLALAALLVAACGPEDARDPTGPDLDAALAQQVEPGDVLVSINGRPVASRAEAIEVMKRTGVDATPWKVVIDRKGERIELDVDPTR